LLAVATYIEIVLWDVQASRVVDRLVNPLSLSIGVVAFDPSGGLLAGGGTNGVLILWDISSRRLLGVLSGSSSVRPLISSIAFSPDGNTVAASDRDGAISVYPVRLSDWVARACAIAGRNLTLAEWSAYLSDTPYEFVCPPVPEGPMGTPVARRRKDSPSTIGRH
jgi:WD40 repeat protein